MSSIARLGSWSPSVFLFVLILVLFVSSSCDKTVFSSTKLATPLSLPPIAASVSVSTQSSSLHRGSSRRGILISTRRQRPHPLEANLLKDSRRPRTLKQLRKGNDDFDRRFASLNDQLYSLIYFRWINILSFRGLSTTTDVRTEIGKSDWALMTPFWSRNSHPSHLNCPKKHLHLHLRLARRLISKFPVQFLFRIPNLSLPLLLFKPITRTRWNSHH